MKPKRPGSASRPPWREAPARRADQRQGRGPAPRSWSRRHRHDGRPSLRGLSDPDLFELAQRQGRALVTYNRPDFEAIVREYAEANREHHGLVIVHPLRFPSREFGRLTSALCNLLEGPRRGGSFSVWLEEARN